MKHFSIHYYLIIVRSTSICVTMRELVRRQHHAAATIDPAKHSRWFTCWGHHHKKNRNAVRHVVNLLWAHFYYFTRKQKTRRFFSFAILIVFIVFIFMISFLVFSWPLYYALKCSYTNVFFGFSAKNLNVLALFFGTRTMCYDFVCKRKNRAFCQCRDCRPQFGSHQIKQFSWREEKNIFIVWRFSAA